MTKSASELIDERIDELGDWRGEILAEVRRMIRDSLPAVIEEWKWRGVPVWSHDGIICTGESYKNYIKLTFPRGASMADPEGMFNAGLEGNVRRAIDIHEGIKLNERAFKVLIRSAAELNAQKMSNAQKKSKARPEKKAGPKA